MSIWDMPSAEFFDLILNSELWRKKHAADNRCARCGGNIPFGISTKKYCVTCRDLVTREQHARAFKKAYHRVHPPLCIDCGEVAPRRRSDRCAPCQKAYRVEYQRVQMKKRRAARMREAA